MGSTTSSRPHATKEQKAQRTIEQQHLVQDRITRISEKQKQLDSGFKTGAVARQQYIDLHNIAETAKHQLERNDRPLVKTDLVAILIRLRPENAVRMKEIYSNYTIGELNSAIRMIIYTPPNEFGAIDEATTTPPTRVIMPSTTLTVARRNTHNNRATSRPLITL